MLRQGVARSSHFCLRQTVDRLRLYATSHGWDKNSTQDSQRTYGKPRDCSLGQATHTIFFLKVKSVCRLSKAKSSNEGPQIFYCGAPPIAARDHLLNESSQHSVLQAGGAHCLVVAIAGCKTK